MTPAKYAQIILLVPICGHVLIGIVVCLILYPGFTLMPIYGLALLHFVIGWPGRLKELQEDPDEGEIWMVCLKRFLFGIFPTVLFFLLSKNYYDEDGMNTDAVYAPAFIVFVLWVPCFVLKMWIKSLSDDGDGETHIRGARLAEFSEIQKAQKAEVGSAKNNLYFGGAMLPASAATTHFLVTGTTGSGKTLTLTRLMKDALCEMIVQDCRAVVYDAKRDAISVLEKLNLGVPIHTLNPFDARGVGWQIGKDFTEPRHVEALTEAIISDPASHGQNAFFPAAVRAALNVVLKTFLTHSNGSWTLRDVILAMSNKDRLKEILKLTPEGEDTLSSYFSDPRQLASILATASTELGPYKTLAASWHFAEKQISLRDWRSDCSILVLPNDHESRPTIDVMNRLIFKRLTELVLNLPNSNDRRIWFFLDELSDAAKLDGLLPLVKEGRSKGVCCALGFQSIEGMQLIYEEKGANEIADQCGNKILLKVTGDVTAEWSSKLIGEQEEWQTSYGENKSFKGEGRGFFFDPMAESTSRNESKSRATKRTVLPAEFQTLPKTSMKNGLTGYYISGIYPPFRKTTSLQEYIFENKGLADSDTDFIPRDVAHQTLPPWDTDDVLRLGLPLEIITGESSEGVASDPVGNSGPRVDASKDKKDVPKFIKKINRQSR